LRNPFEQVWALLPGFCACARDAAEALPSIAQSLGRALAEKPEVRGHVLSALSLLVLTARSRKGLPAPGTTPAPGTARGPTELALTPDAEAALATVGRFGKNFLPLLFDLHLREPPAKRPALQEAVRTVASVTPDATLGELFKALMRKLLEPSAAAEAPAAEALEAQRSMLDLLLAVAPSLSLSHVGMLHRAVQPMMLASDVLLQKKAYKVLGGLCEYHAAYATAELPALKTALDEALPACLPGAKGKRLACLQAVASALPAAALHELLPALLGEVVLACKEVNVKTRAAAFEFLVALSSTAERRAVGGVTAKADAVRSIFVMVAGGLAGNTPHMMAAALAALGRLTFEMRSRPALELTLTQLFATVLSLLSHPAQEVAKAAISYCKVALMTLPPDAARPLLPRLVPPLLLWCSNKHPHLKTQVRYIMERLVKRFGYDAMLEVTPEAHHRLLAHLRKQKAYAHNKAVERRAERDARRTMGLREGGGEDEDEDEAAARRERHAEYEALLEEEAADADEGGDEGGEDEGAEVADHARAAGRKGRGALTRTPRGASLQGTWRDQSSSAAGLDLLSAPMLPDGDLGELRRAAGGKRRRGEAAGAEAHVASLAQARAERASSRAAAEAAAEEGSVRVDPESGRLVISEGRRSADVVAMDGVVEEPEEEGGRTGGGRLEQAKKRRRLAEGAVASASKAEEDEADAPTAAPTAAPTTRTDERNKRRVTPRGGGHDDHFGANFGDQFAGKKGAGGDVLREGSMKPYAYLPLNPRLLGKKQQRKAIETLSKLATPMTKRALKAARKASGNRVGLHGLQARRSKGARRNNSGARTA
jgi:ribosomal RNA-processing protein 12